MIYPDLMGRPTLFLIDGNNQMYRAYHAFRGRGLSNSGGQSTHAVYVFVTMLRKLVADGAVNVVPRDGDARPTSKAEYRLHP